MGTRSRAGNAMGRTRAKLLEGALRAIREQGPQRTTMADIAGFAGVAKATLYNHFRTRDDVWSALVAAEVETLAIECAQLPLAEALTHAAMRVSSHPALRRLAAADPVALARLVTGSEAPGWQAARQAVRTALDAEGRTGDDIVLRWLSSHLSTPGSPDAIGESAAVLVAGLPLTGESAGPASSAPAERS